MQIPTSYRLMAHTIKVKRVPVGKWKDDQCVGQFSTERKQILVRDSHDTLTTHIFAHEMVHSILDAMGHPLNSDESFVDSFSGLLHQVLSTAKYPRQSSRPRKQKRAPKAQR